ncbi:MAG: helix-turn-helix domain-containing protein [Bacilli bacterium]
MRDFDEREVALKMYFEQGCSYRYIANELNIPRDTVKSWCHRYRTKVGIPSRIASDIKHDVTVKSEFIRNRNIPDDSDESRIARLEMEVELLRNFLMLTEKG